MDAASWKPNFALQSGMREREREGGGEETGGGWRGRREGYVVEGRDVSKRLLAAESSESDGICEMIDGRFGHMTFRDQILSEYAVDAIVGAQGAGLAHLAFARPHTTVVDFVKTGRMRYMNMAKWRDFRYDRLHPRRRRMKGYSSGGRMEPKVVVHLVENLAQAYFASKK